VEKQRGEKGIAISLTVGWCFVHAVCAGWDPLRQKSSMPQHIQACFVGVRQHKRLCFSNLSFILQINPCRYPKIVKDVIEEHPEIVNGVEVPVDTSTPNPNEMEFDNLYLVGFV